MAAAKSMTPAGNQRTDFAQTVAKTNPGPGIFDAEKFVEQLQLRLFHGQNQSHGIGVRFQVGFFFLFDRAQRGSIFRDSRSLAICEASCK